MNKTKKEIDILIRARYPVINIVSWEEGRVEDMLSSSAIFCKFHMKALLEEQISLIFVLIAFIYNDFSCNQTTCLSFPYLI